MGLFDALAEERIRGALARGEFDNLPGLGKPLELDDDLLVPEDLRLGNRILKNAGVAPPQLQLRREVVALQAAIRLMAHDAERVPALARLQALRVRLASEGGRTLALEAQYADKVMARLGSSTHEER